MKVKKVNQYQCEFCGKKQYSVGHMRKHEKHCTMNPNRYCRMCEFIEVDQVDIPTLLGILPNPKDYLNKNLEYESYDGLEEALKKPVESLRTMTNGCPVCMMAALRQKGIYLTMVKDRFDFEAECKEIFVRIRDEEYEREREADYIRMVMG